jgi:antitoxin component YwqK of YwqJK toxin-antitoxin module
VEPPLIFRGGFFVDGFFIIEVIFSPIRVDRGFNFHTLGVRKTTIIIKFEIKNMKKLLLGLGLLSISFLGLGQVTNYNLSIEKTIIVNDEEEKIQTIEGIFYHEGTPLTGKKIVKYPDGQVKSKGTYKDGKLEGLLEQYYENGQVKSKMTFKDEIPEGLIEMYYENGQVKSKMTFKDGKPEGLIEMYYENGQVKSKGTFKDEKPEGLIEEYYENGQVKLKGTYKDGKLEGLLEQYYENGQVKSKGTTKDMDELQKVSKLLIR